MFGNCNERTFCFTAAIGTFPRAHLASSRRPGFGLGYTGRAPAITPVRLFPNLPALSFNRLFLTQPRASQLGSVLGGISPAVASAQPRFCGLLSGGSWASWIPDPEGLVGGACSRAVLAAFLHHSVTGARGPDVQGFREAPGRCWGAV